MTAINHSDRDHALLNPSGSEMWLTCTPSARLGEHIPGTSSVYADQGTLAHQLSEIKIPHMLGWITEAQYRKQLKAQQQKPLYQHHSSEMDDYVDEYCRYVVSTYMRLLGEDPETKIYLEQRISMTEWIPESFGSLDVHIVSQYILHIIDLKFGTGIPVDAEENTQMKIYALGVLSKYHAFTHYFEKIHITIHQPRINNISEWETTPEAIMAWGETYVKPRAILAFKGEGEFVPSEKGCRWCKVKAQCRALRDHNMKLAMLEFADPPLLSSEEIGEVLDKIDPLTKWAEAVKKYAFKQALMGTAIPGHKLVTGRSNRVYASEFQVLRALTKAGFNLKQLTERSILPVTKMQKKLGKDFNAILEVQGLIHKPEGKPTLVPESDKRKEYELKDSAETDFGDLNENDYND